jgi:tetratricopeptide (TPR) repeat protein
MGRLEEAKGRLDNALARLEKVAQRPLSDGAPASDPDTVAALAASRAECATLEAQTREVSDRLDAAIERLQAVLKEDEENGPG